MFGIYDLKRSIFELIRAVRLSVWVYIIKPKSLYIATTQRSGAVTINAGETANISIFFFRPQTSLLPPPPSGSSTRGRSAPATSTPTPTPRAPVFSPNKSAPNTASSNLTYDLAPVSSDYGDAGACSLVDNVADAVGIRTYYWLNFKWSLYPNWTRRSIATSSKKMLSTNFL